MQIGTYGAEAEAAGFETAIADQFTVKDNARQRVDLTSEFGVVKVAVDFVENHKT